MTTEPADDRETSGFPTAQEFDVPRYYLQLRNRAGEMLDPDGSECLDIDALRNVVLFNARDVIAGDVRRGRIDLSFRIDAEDASGALVHSLPFADAVDVVPEENFSGGSR